MLKLTFEGANTAELHQSIADYTASIAEGGTTAEAASPKKLKKVEETPSDDEPAATKKKTTADIKEISDAAVREKLQGNDWPIEQCKAFMKKFGYDSVPSIPQKRRAEFLELIAEASEWSAKKLSAYLETEEL